MEVIGGGAEMRAAASNEDDWRVRSPSATWHSNMEPLLWMNPFTFSSYSYKHMRTIDWRASELLLCDEVVGDVSFGALANRVEQVRDRHDHGIIAASLVESVEVCVIGID